MRTLMMFYGSCGHVTVNVVPDGTYERHKALGYKTREGYKTRMVYVEPVRYCICIDCFGVELQKILSEQLR